MQSYFIIIDQIIPQKQSSFSFFFFFSFFSSLIIYLFSDAASFKDMQYTKI